MKFLQSTVIRLRGTGVLLLTGFMTVLLCLFPATNRAKDKIVYQKFALQPWQGVQIFQDGKDIALRPFRRDKTLALFRLPLPPSGKAILTFKKEGRTTIEKELGTHTGQTRDAIWLFQLMKQGSRFSLQQYVRTGKQPKSATFIDSRRISVPLLADPGIDIIDFVSGNVRRIAPPRKYARHAGFVESLVLPDRGELWVTQMHNSRIHIFDIKSLNYLHTIKLRSSYPKVLLYDPDRHLVYCSSWVSRNIAIIDPNKRKEIRRIQAGGVPRGMALGEREGFLYVAQFSATLNSSGDGRLVKIDLKSGRIAKILSGRGSKRHLVKDSRGRLYVTDMSHGTVEVFDLKNDRVIKTIRVYAKPNTIVLDPGEKYLYVSCRGPNGRNGYTRPGPAMGRIYVIELENFTISEFWEGGNQPTGLCISIDGRTLVSTDFLDHAIRIYRKKE